METFPEPSFSTGTGKQANDEKALEVELEQVKEQLRRLMKEKQDVLKYDGPKTPPSEKLCSKAQDEEITDKDSILLGREDPSVSNHDAHH